ncbi:histidine kinase [Streptomyces sp. NPDC048295]|uniref:sensor histidine kinase n=1 Tax=Streptomyces sp. NPDC048295 TaxID=3154617 RepID=UPI003421B06D
MILRRQIPELWHRLDVTVRDLPLGVLLLVASLLPSLRGNGTEVGGLPTRPADALAGVAVVLQCLPLAVRRRWPLACVALVAGGFALDQLRGYHLFAGSALPIALLSAGSYLERYRRTTLIVLTAAFVALSVALHRIGSGSEPVSEFVTFYLALAPAWGIGMWMRSARAAEADRHKRGAEDARNAERARIASELHDIVTHHVTAMVVQSEAARYLTAAPDRLDQSLAAVSDTGRRAITDLRHLLDLLNPDHSSEPRTPPVGRLLTLVEQTRRAGQPVEFTEEGTPATTTDSANLVAYRVVQEALTNALKHDRGGKTSVLVRHCESEITVEVDTDGSGSRAGSPSGSGRGLVGLRERVDVLGGDFSSGPRTGGGFAVRARIPGRNPS